MSVELEVRLVRGPVEWPSFLRELAAVLRHFATDTAQSLAIDNGSNETIGGLDAVFHLELGPDASVEGRCYSVPETEPADEEAGQWVRFSVAQRTPESFLLMALATASFAIVSGSPILDEAGMFRRGRWLKPSEVIEAAGETQGVSFAEAALRLESHLHTRDEPGRT